jgi:hypothetical protein
MISLARMRMGVRKKKVNDAAACKMRDWVGWGSLKR